MDISNSFKPFALGLALVVGLSGCVIHDPYFHGHDNHVYVPQFYPLYYDYHYYPSVQVYFSFSTGHYYYPHGKKWIRAKVLPPHILLDSRERVTTRIKDDKPYRHNKQHLKQYQPSHDYRPDAKNHKIEQTRNLKSYDQHQKKQKVYEQEWKKRKKIEKNRY